MVLYWMFYDIPQQCIQHVDEQVHGLPGAKINVERGALIVNLAFNETMHCAAAASDSAVAAFVGHKWLCVLTT